MNLKYVFPQRVVAKTGPKRATDRSLSLSPIFLFLKFWNFQVPFFKDGTNTGSDYCLADCRLVWGASLVRLMGQMEILLMSLS